MTLQEHWTARRRLIHFNLVVIVAGGGFASVVTPAQAVGQSVPTQACPVLGSLLEGRLGEFRIAAGFPGATAALVLSDGSLIEMAVGMSDTARAVPMRTDHRLFQGSVGKTYFSAVAHLLMEEGRLDLDARIASYLPEEVVEPLPNGLEVTVRQLMNHTSGIQRYELRSDFLEEMLADPDRVWRPEEQLAFLHGEEPPFAAGQGWDYSDTNYIVLAMIMERLTGEDMYDVIRERLLGPLGLENTLPSNRRDLPGLSQGYGGPSNPFGPSDAMVENGRFAFNPGWEWAGGGFISTSGDLARWAAHLYGGDVLSSESMEKLLDGVPARLGRGARYGLGVILREGEAGPTHGHSGFFPGYVAEVWHYPQDRITVAVQINTSHGGALRGAPPTRIVDALAIEARAFFASGASCTAGG